MFIHVEVDEETGNINVDSDMVRYDMLLVHRAIIKNLEDRISKDLIFSANYDLVSSLESIIDCDDDQTQETK